MEKTMEEREAKTYREELEELAISRGFEDAEAVARQAARLDPSYSVRTLLEDPAAGFGRVLNAVLRMSEEEMRRLVDAFTQTFINPPRS
jgi:hypothetical protein